MANEPPGAEDRDQAVPHRHPPGRPRRPDRPARPHPPAERRYDIRHWSEFERGGHFAAMEVPELLAGDVRDFFLTLLDKTLLDKRLLDKRLLDKRLLDKPESRVPDA